MGNVRGKKMVSDKAIIVLIIVAILLSSVSIIFTLSSSFAIDKIPQVNEERIPDADSGRVSIIINPQPTGNTP